MIYNLAHISLLHPSTGAKVDELKNFELNEFPEIESRIYQWHLKLMFIFVEKSNNFEKL